MEHSGSILAGELSGVAHVLRPTGLHRDTTMVGQSTMLFLPACEILTREQVIGILGRLDGHIDHRQRQDKRGRWNFVDIFALFPNLKARQDTSAGVLSGGEQQMLTMCRTLMGDPDLILIDEPTEGLAPKLVEQVGELLAEIGRRGVSVLLVEQKLAIALKISARLYVMGHGRIVFQGTPADFGENAAVRKEWLEV